jgi:NADPH:quinone reductase-like Zn-dependent oxidoreductase
LPPENAFLLRELWKYGAFEHHIKLVRAVVETVLPLSQAKRAQELSEAGHVRGKIVLSVD